MDYITGLLAMLCDPAPDNYDALEF
jgi:hypothetical protein